MLGLGLPPLLLLCCCWAPLCFGFSQSFDSDFTFTLPAGQKECFYQTMKKDATLEIEYQVGHWVVSLLKVILLIHLSIPRVCEPHMCVCTCILNHT